MRGQISIDFIITVILLMLLFLFVFGVALDRQQFNRDRIYRMQAESKANVLAKLINSVYQAGDGAATEKDFYQALQNNRPYNMTVLGASRRVEIRWGDQFYTAQLQTSDVVGGRVNGTVAIRNSGGTVYVE